ncbi:MAG: AraC family transcriptional regulator [Rikenellaceae bacterium]
MNIFEFEKVKTSENNSFAFSKYCDKLFMRNLHLHPEMEVVYIEQGRGECVVVDNITTYAEGDLYFFGSNLPHYFKSDLKYHNAVSDAFSCSTYIQFQEGILPADYNTMPGCKYIKELVDAGSRGVKWHLEADSPIVIMLQEMKDTDGFVRLNMLYELLHTLGTTLHSGQLIASSSYTLSKRSSETKYFQIINYINLNYKDDITLEDLASFCNMNRSAMCRYFKSKSGQSIFSYILDVRIAIAKELLATSDEPISQILYSTGFNSISNFNANFKRITSFTPSQYREKIRANSCYCASRC